MGEYDRIIKENIEALLMGVAKRLLGFEVKDTVPLTEKLQTTVEREPDFLKKVSLEDGRQIILHLEFQRQDEAGMVYRMAEYRAIIQRKYRLPVRQFVIYLGTDQLKMRTKLSAEEQIKGFSLRNLHEIPVDEVLSSDVPEALVFAILTDYPLSDAGRVISRIIAKLKRTSGSETALRKALQQLLTLSRVRKLELETQRQITAMPITYDIETDGLYLQGIEKGKVEEKARLVANLLKETSLTDEQIAKVAEVSADFVQSLRDTSPQ